MDYWLHNIDGQIFGMRIEMNLDPTFPIFYAWMISSSYVVSCYIDLLIDISYEI